MLALIFSELWARKLRALLIVFSVATAAGAATLFLSAGVALSQFVSSLVSTSEDARLFEVIPASMEIGVFRLKRPGLLGSQGLDDATIARMGRVEGVAAVYPKRAVRVPLGAEGGGRFFGKSMYSDLVAEGVDERLLAKHVDPKLLAWTPDQPIPVVVSQQLVQLYNQSIAPSLGFPGVAQDILIGFEFDLIVGRSYMLGTAGAKKAEKRRARIVGVSPFGMRVGATFPLSVVDWIEKEFRTEASPPEWTAAWVEARDLQQASTVASAVTRLGLRINDDERRMADAVQIAGLAVGLLGATILLLAALAVGQAFAAQLVERRADLALFRAMGATPWRIIRLVCGQAIVVIGVGVTVGSVAAALIAQALDQRLQQWVSELPVRPSAWFVVDMRVLGIASGITLLAAFVGMALPLWRALRVPVASVLAASEQ